MSRPTGFWCPVCGDMKRMPTPFPWLGGNAWLHNGPCTTGHPVPVFEPLDVPEVTTWGESGGAEAVTLQINGSTPWWMLGDSHARVVDHSHSCGWWMSGPRVYTDTDVVAAINYVAGVRK